MKPYPQFPEEWNKAENTLYREFHLKSTPDIECLMRLVKDNLYDKGNEGILRARLLGILRSYFSRANAEFWEKHYHPKTWRIRIAWRNVRQYYHRTFNTRQFRGGVMLSNLAHEVATEMIEKTKNQNNG
jgi:hypothetical protein